MKRLIYCLLGIGALVNAAPVMGQDYGEKVEEDANTVLARKLPKADHYFYVRGAGKAPNVAFDDTLNTTDEWRRVAKWQVDMRDLEGARVSYRHFINTKVATKDDLWNYVQILKGLGKYDETLAYMRRMRDMAPEDLRVKEYFRTVYTFSGLRKQNAAYRIHDLSINTVDNHSCAVYYVKDQVVLLFSKNKKGKVTKNRMRQATALDNVDLDKVTSWKGEDWNKAILNGPLCFAKSGKLVAATCIDRELYDSLGVIRPQIYFSTMKQRKWLEPEWFDWNDTLGNYSVAHPALNKQGTMMIFASDRPGGFGGSDLWMTFKQGKRGWSEPVNLGDKINTEGDELFPFFDQPTGKLYFSSNGHNGLGGLDIYEAVQKDSCICSYEIKNLGAPMNSVSDDYAIVWNKKHTHGYFTSNRKEGKGGEDIYKFLYTSSKDPTAPHLYEPNVKEKNGNVQADGRFGGKAGNGTADNRVTKTFTVLKGGDDEPIADAEVVVGTDTFRTNVNGEAQLKLPIDADGTIQVSALGYKPATYGYKKGGVIGTATGKLEVARGENLVLKNIYYDFDRSEILPESAKELDRLVAFMEDNPDVQVELSSHTDSRGSDEYNLELSQKRAEAAVAYVVGQGIDPERIAAKGYGETKPLNGCVNGVECTEEQYRQNRRTEIFIPKVGAALNVKQTQGKYTTQAPKKRPVYNQAGKMKPVGIDDEDEELQKTRAKRKDDGKAVSSVRHQDVTVEDGSFQWHRKMTKEEEDALAREALKRQDAADKEANDAEAAYEKGQKAVQNADGYQVIRHADGTIEKRYTLY